MKPRPLESDPFSEFNCLPLGFYLDPEAWQVEAFRSRASVRHFRRLIATSRFADDFAAQLSRGTWGEEYEGGWTTLVSGKRRETRFKVETIKPLSAEMLLKAFTRMDRFGVGTRDRFEPSWLSVSPDAERAHISNIRFDIDMDSVFEDENLSRLTEAVSACREVGDLLQLQCSVMTTGRRGVQAHFMLPARIATNEARSVRDSLRALLAKKLPLWAALDKDSVDHLLRLPLTRHIKTRRLALYIGADCQVLPVEEQVECALRTFTPTGIESIEELMARLVERQPNPQCQTAPMRVPLTPSDGYGLTFNGPRDDYWSTLIKEPLMAGRTWEYLAERSGVYAHVVKYGRSEAKKRLREKVQAMPDDGKLAERLYKVERLVETCDIWQIEPAEFLNIALTDDEARQVESYVEELRTRNIRRDCLARQEMVYAAWLVAERQYGLQVTGARIARIVQRLFGAEAPQVRAVYRALDMLRESNKIWFVTLRAEAVEQRLCGSFLVPEGFRE